MSVEETLKKLIAQCAATRSAQKKYFTIRKAQPAFSAESKTALAESKEQEKILDNLIHNIQNAEQKELFDK